MQGSGPHVPERGWETRWVMQALDLGLHAPAAFLILIVAVLFFGVSLLAIVPFLTGPWAGIIALSGAIAAASFPVLLIHGALMEADGTGSIPTAVALKRAQALGATAFLFTSAMLSLHVLVPRPAGAAAPVRDLFQYVFFLGLKPVLSIHVSLMIINPICLALSAGVGFSPQENMMASLRMFMRMVPVWMALMFGTTLAASGLLLLPAVLALPGAMVLIAWTHVAAREIFGGLRENGTSRRKAPLPHAA